jgi:DNA-binding protein HU-beta
MTKADLVYDIERQTKLPKETIALVVEEFMQSVQKNLLRGENIYLRGFGGFVLKKRAEKTARNLQSNTEIKVPAHYVATFKVSKEFNERVKIKVKRANNEAK